VEPTVSVIIPVYQVEKYLDKCIASVVGQTYQNLQIILIDDGSTDRSPAICDEWKERDPRITVIHQPNGGLSRARNAGLKVATGKFVGFVDSDDWIEPNMVECLLAALQKTDADIAVGGFEGFTEDSKSIPYAKAKSTERSLCSTGDALKRLLLLRGFIRNFVWNKLYRRTVLSGIAFPEGRLYEDVTWTAQVIGNAKSVVCVNQIFYHYLHRPDSLSRDDRQFIRRLQDELELTEQRLDYIHRHHPSLDKFAVLRLHNLICRYYIDISLHFRHLDPDRKIRDDLRERFSRHRPSIFLDLRYFGKAIARLLLWILCIMHNS
jgi:glycosyltransferase involved in cell wall biosynthesis